MGLKWDPTQVAIASMLKPGKATNDITEHVKCSRQLVNKVRKALKAGDNPPIISATPPAGVANLPAGDNKTPAGTPLRTALEVAKDKPPPKEKLPKGKGGASGKEMEGGEMVTVVGKTPASIIFALGTSRIELEPQALYETYLLYEDIKTRCQLTDSFAYVIRDAVGLMWQILVSNPKIEQGQIRMEVAREPGNGSS